MPKDKELKETYEDIKARELTKVINELKRNGLTPTEVECFELGVQWLTQLEITKKPKV